MAFNDLVSPKAKTELFKIYVDVSSGTTAEYELQGRGVAEWTVDNSEDIEKNIDVLGYVEMDRGIAQPVQSGVAIKLRKGSKLAELLFNAWYSGDKSKLDNISILQKFEFIDAPIAEGETVATSCLAKLEKGCVISLNSFNGEAGGYLGFEIDINYSNDRVLGTMTKVDANPVVFTPNT